MKINNLLVMLVPVTAITIAIVSFVNAKPTVRYDLKFEGKAGQKIIGNYSVNKIPTTATIKSTSYSSNTIEGTIPYTKTLDLPKGYIVTVASSNSVVRIFKNGVECTEAPVPTGSTAQFTVVQCIDN